MSLQCVYSLIDRWSLISVILLLLLISSCRNESGDVSVNRAKVTGTKLFNTVATASSGLSFNNQIIESEQINYYKYVYLYNGGGVGIADINNDGLQDIYFTSTQGKDKLFLNKGNLKFEDISTTAGISINEGCKTGVTFVDINADSQVDIYVSRSGWDSNPSSRQNLLFINQGNNIFEESAAAYGLADSGHSVQTVFFDYDRDGDLDAYVANHPKTFVKPIREMIANVQNPNPEESDRLYRNNGDNTFTNISQEAGILNYTYSLGVVAADLNSDGWTDLYVTSDFQPRDHYYLNQGDGTFREALEQYFPHCSYFSMGVDVVDINNDGHLDIFTGEMLSEDNLRQKTNMAPMDMQRFADMVNNGMHFQYMRNALHLNNGNGHFSDLAHYSGIDKSDWSWASLFSDYDHDGDEDLLVVNGWLRDTQDKDFSKKTNELAKKTQNRLTFEQAYSVLKSTPLKNYAFENKGEMKFEKVSDSWGFDHLGFSNGMAIGDLDNDGDLDVVVNNINADASLYENTINNDAYLRIKFEGPKSNKLGYNTRVKLTSSLGSKFKEFQVTRGFQSSCEPVLHFGLAQNEVPQRLDILWSDGKTQSVTEVTKGNMVIRYIPNNANGTVKKPEKSKLFEEDTKQSLKYKHQEEYVDDYKVQVLLPHLLSQLGPALATADIDGNGSDEIYLGGSRGQAGKIFQRNQNGNYIELAQFDEDKMYEDIDAIFLDADHDDDLDLYVVSGSYEYPINSKLLEDRLYLNNDGVYKRDRVLLPSIRSSGGSIAAADYDGDGDQDLFVGGRLIHGKYPQSPRSYLLINTPTGYIDKTKELAPDLLTPGMISASEWTDYDGDGDIDLMIAGEWTDILIYENVNGRLEKNDKILSKSLVGWWNVLKSGDLDGDGDLDFIAGNLGENYKYEASDEQPFELFAGDFDNNGSNDIVVSYHCDDKLFPVRGFQCSSEQMPTLKSSISSYEEFGQSDVYKIYGSALDNAFHVKANCFSSVILWNQDGQLVPEKLPFQAQLAPIQDVVMVDIDQDKDLDIIAAGNWYMSEVETPRADSGVGVVLENIGQKQFRSISSEDSGFFANRDVRKLACAQSANGRRHFVVANNNSEAQLFILE